MKKRDDGWITANELMDRLNADPAFVARREQQEAEFAKREAELRIAEAPLLDELRSAGLTPKSVWHLCEAPGTYDHAVPLLLAHLRRPYPSVIRDGIARALGVPATRATAWRDLIGAYGDEGDEYVRSGLACSIAACAKRDDLELVLELLRDPRHGESRLHLLKILARSKDPRAWPALLALAEDPQLAQEIRVMVKRRSRRKPATDR